MTRDEIKGAIEALLFITDRPLPIEELKKLAASGEEDVAAIVEELRSDYEARGGVRLLHVAEGWQLATRAEHGEAIRRLYQDRTTFRLSTAALETLAIVAYRQPLTRAEIEEIRGVEVIAALETLLEKRLLKVVGRKEAMGRPLLYGTTEEFLRQFGLGSLSELPSLDSLPATETPVPAAPAPQGPFASEETLAAAVEVPLGAAPKDLPPDVGTEAAVALAEPAVLAEPLFSPVSEAEHAVLEAEQATHAAEAALASDVPPEVAEAASEPGDAPKE